MKRPEQCPGWDDVLKEGIPKPSPETMSLAKAYNVRYLHRSDLEYRDTGPDSADALWAVMKFLRYGTASAVDLGGTALWYNVTGEAQRILHGLDIRFGRGLVSGCGLDERREKMLAAEFVMEESIASSQLEGATTDIATAKRMLRGGIGPRNESDRMILNNHEAMRFVIGHSGDDLTPELILKIHSIVSEGLLDDARSEGRFRDDNSIAVRDALTGETYHDPPDFGRVPAMVADLCDFANDCGVYVHPAVRATIIHFALAYIHPFVDGNGRVSRALFYWSLLHSGYGSAECLSLSKAIRGHRGRYDRAYLLSETDDNDITYFVNFNLEMISEATEGFLGDVRRSIDGRGRTFGGPRASGLNARQRDLLSDLMDSLEPMDVYELAAKHMVPPAGIRRDLLRMEESGLVRVVRVGHRNAYEYRD